MQTSKPTELAEEDGDVSLARHEQRRGRGFWKHSPSMNTALPSDGGEHISRIGRLPCQNAS